MGLQAGNLVLYTHSTSPLSRVYCCYKGQWHADKIDNRMTRAALLLEFIQGENFKDWVKCWAIWAIDKINTGWPTMDEHFWTTISRAFKQAFQDTGTTGCVEEKLHHLSFTPGEVDTFITKFESLANKAGYQLDARSTITIFTLKLHTWWWTTSIK